MQEQQGGTATANLLLGLGVDERLEFNGQTYLTDLLGSTVGLSNGSAIQTSYAYDPYGVSTSAGTATTNAFQFAGRENDGTSAGLMSYRARYYNPSWGRFVSEDPIGVKGGANLYAYVGQSPTTEIDPTGEAGTWINDPVASAEYDAYKKICIEPVPTGILGLCERAIWTFERSQRCFNALSDWEDKWQSGAHDEAIMQRASAIENARNNVNRLCKTQPPKMCPVTP